MRIRAGDILDGKFVIVHAGAGDAFDVMIAVDLRLDARVALRVVDSAIPEVRTRFLRDARASLCPGSDFVVQLLDCGALSDGSAYLVTEYVDGVDLSQLIQRGPLSLEYAVGCFLQACSAVIHAHQMGLRAYLRAKNVIVQHAPNGAPRVKVAGLGIGPLLSYGGNILGSSVELDRALPYMAPEELSGTTCDYRADIWALGVILYEAVTGQRPFWGESVPELVTQILLSAPDFSVPSTAPVGLASVISKCLRREPKARFDSVHALAAAVGGFARGFRDLRR